MVSTLQQVSIAGYRSIRNIAVDFRPLLAFIGSNNAGKSNIVDAIDFLAQVHEIGLDASMLSAGGLESLLHRTNGGRVRNLCFSTVAVVQDGEALRVSHSFVLELLGDRFGGFRVASEQLTVSSLVGSQFDPNSLALTQISVMRSGEGFITMGPADADTGTSTELKALSRLVDSLHDRKIDKARLFLLGLAPLSPILTAFSESVSAARLFDIAPGDAREDADTSHYPELTRFGSDLPTVLEWLEEDHPREYGVIIAGLREALPALDAIQVVRGHRGTRSIEFIMSKGPSPLSADDVSDGTVRYLGLLAGLHDPRVSFIMIEEPENSLHPWMIARLADQLVKAAESKQIIVTTHSPFLMTKLPLTSIRVVYNRRGETNISQLSELEPQLYELWSRGDVTVFDSVESGAITEMIPSVEE